MLISAGLFCYKNISGNFFHYGYISCRDMEMELENHCNPSRTVKNATLSREGFYLLEQTFDIQENRNLCMNLKMKSMLVNFILNFAIPWYKNLRLNLKNCCVDMRFEDKVFEMDIKSPLETICKKANWNKLFLSAIVAEEEKDWESVINQNPDLKIKEEVTDILKFLSEKET